MKIVTFKQNTALELGNLKFTYFLPAGKDYLFFDRTVMQLRDTGFPFDAQDLPNDVACYAGENLNSRSLLFTSLGGYGDVLCLVQALNALQNRYPGAQIDLAVTPDQYALARQFNFKGGWLPSPTRLEALKKYDYLQSSEDLHNLKGHHYDRDNVARMCFDLFSLPLDLSHSPYRPGASRIDIPLREGPKKRVAIQVDALWGSNRCYPTRHVTELAMLLCKKGCEVFLTGFHRTLAGSNGNSGIRNLINRTPSVLDLAALLSGMDAIVSPDSLSGHIGGMLGIPTVVLFSVTGTNKLDHYPSVHAMASRLPCSPCHQLFKCPKGLEGCEAFDESSVAPARIMEKIRHIMEEA